MSNSNFSDLSELALAGYGQFLSKGTPPTARLTDLNGDPYGFSERQADRFASRFNVTVPTFNDATSMGGSGATSFDVTVFSGKIGVDKDRIFISFRGTGQKTGRPDDLDSALQNASTGAAISQIVQMVNWWQRVSTTAGVDVSQFFVPTDRNEAVRINDAKATGEVYALLLAAPQAKVTVTGSSLGGHLAMAFATLFPQYTQSAVAFNAPGFGSQAGLKTLFATLGGTVPEVGNPLIANFVSREVNIATDPTDLLAGFPNDSFPGLKLTVPIENQFNTDVPDAKVPSWNHDQRQVTDALTVFDMLRRLDGSLDLTRFDYLLRASAEGENRSLENLVDSVESVLGINRAQLPAGNDRRDTLHGAVQALVGGAPQTPNPNAAFHSLAGKVVIAPTDFSLRVHARENFGAFVALQELSPFYLAGKDPAARQLLDSVLETTRSSEFATWNRDKTSGFGLTFTDRWIADRQALVRALAIQNTENNTTGQIVDQRIATDRTTQFSYVGGAIPGDEAQASRHTLFAQSRPGQPSQIIFFGTDGDDVATGNGNLLGDHLYGGAGADQLDGLAGNDYLEGGSGSDSYIFSANFGHDTIVDSDGLGSLTIDGQVLSGGKASGKAGEWLGQDGAGQIERYVLQDNRQSSTGQQLVVSRLGGVGDSITINHFDLAAAQGGAGYLGLTLDDTQQLVVAQAAAVPANGNSPFEAWNFDPNTFTGQTAVAEGGASVFTVFLRSAAKAGDSLVLALSALGDKFRVLTGRTSVAANGAVIDLQEGQTQVSVSLLQEGSVEGGGAAVLTANFNGGGESVASNAWTIQLQDAGAPGQTLSGDSTVFEITSNGTLVRDGRVVVPAGSARYVVGADNNLVGGAGTLITHNVLYGAAGNDQLSGLGGNDALDGGTGNDVLWGGDGDDLIAGGAGSNQIEGGAGRDFIAAGGRLSANLQQIGPLDTWLAPVGKPVLASGATWGVVTDSADLTVWDGMVDAGTGVDGNDVDAGAGDDHVIGGGGDDRIAGGLGDDHIDGMGGADFIETGDGNDTVRADGMVLPGYLNSTLAVQHAADFVDGGDGDDHLQGGGNADILYGGSGADQIYGDSAGRSDSEFFVRLESHGADYLDGEAGDDYLEGGGGDDVLMGGDGGQVFGEPSVCTRTRSASRAGQRIPRASSICAWTAVSQINPTYASRLRTALGGKPASQQWSTLGEASCGKAFIAIGTACAGWDRENSARTVVWTWESMRLESAIGGRV